MSRIEFADGQGWLEYNYLAKIILEEYNDKASTYLQTHDYKQLMRTNIWKQARSFILGVKSDKDNKLHCEHCGDELSIEVSVFMHHDHYYEPKIFNMDSISAICRKCNAVVHKKKWRK